jgi:hypothetical protein
MPDEPNPLDDAIKNIDRKLDERTSRQDEILEKHGNTLSAISDKLNPREPEPKSWLDDDEEQPVTRKDLKIFHSEIKGEMKDVSKEVVTNVVDKKTNTGNRDSEAFHDFPELHKGGELFNPIFKKEVEAEMSQKLGRVASEEDRAVVVNSPDFLYDAAATVWAKWARQGRTAPRHVIEESHAAGNANADSFPITGRASPTKGKLTDYQTNLAQRMGMNMGRLRERIENKGKK